VSKRNRWITGIIGALISCVVASAILMVAKGIGRKTMEVVVWVIDTDIPSPVTDAKVTIFRGQTTAIDFNTEYLHLSSPAKFLPDPNSPYTQTNTTNSYGTCSFQYVFTAVTSDSWFSHTGSVRTSGTWVYVTASGRPPVLVPIDRQGIYPRDINDKSPVCVTVVLNRCGDDKTD